MATYETVVRLNIDNKEAVRRLGAMEKELVEVRRRTRELNAQTKDNATLTKEQAYEMGVLRSRAKNLSGQIRELSNDTSGLTAANLRFRDKMAQATKDAILPFGTGIAAVSAGVAIGTQKLIQFTGELQDLAGEIQALDRKALIVFGDNLERVNAVAEENAIQMGLTTREYINAAAGVQDLLVPLGFAREEAAGLSTDVVDLAGALSLWTGGQVSAEEAASRLQKGILGETESLKELGIVIDQSSKDYNRRIAILQEERGVTREQARALDILRQITEKTADAQANYAEGQGLLVQQQAEANARLREAKENLAQELTPAFIAANNAAGSYIETITGGINAQATFTERVKGLIAVMPGLVGLLAGVFSGSDDVAAGADKASKALDIETASLDELKKELERASAARKEFREEGNLVAASLEQAREEYAKQRIAEIEGRTAEADSLASLRIQLKDAQAAREELREGDTAALSANEALIHSLERRIAAMTVSTQKAEKEAAVIRVITDELRAYNKALSDVNQGVGIGQLDTSIPDAGPGDAQPLGVGITIDQLDAETLAYVNSRDTMAQADEDFSERSIAALATYSQAVGESLAKALQDSEEASEAFLSVTLQAVRSAVRLWLAALFAQEVGTKSFAGLATFAALSTLVETAFAAAQNSIQGFADGGMIQGGQKIRRSNGDNVLITARVGEVIFNEEQQRNLEAMLGPGVWRALGIPGFATGGPVQNSGYVLSKRRTGIAAPRPSSDTVVSSRLAGVTEQLANTPIFVSWAEGQRVGRRATVTEGNASL